MTEENKLVARESRDGVEIVRLDQPPVNAMDIELLGALEKVLVALEAGADGALILTGSGTCFSAGLDLKKLPSYDADQRTRLLDLLNRVLLKLYGFPRPVIGAINGHAIAGGFILMVACDYRILSKEATVGLTEVKVGVPFPGAPLEIIRAELPPAAARRLALSGSLIDAPRALTLGVVDEVVSGGELMDRALAVAHELGALPTVAFARIKRSLRSEPLARIQSVLRTTDPALGFWRTVELSDTAAGVLRKRD